MVFVPHNITDRRLADDGLSRIEWAAGEMLFSI